MYALALYVFFVLPALLRTPAPPPLPAAVWLPCASAAAEAESAAASAASCSARALRFASSLILADATHKRTCMVKHLDLQRAREAAAAGGAAQAAHIMLKLMNIKNEESMGIEPSPSERS